MHSGSSSKGVPLNLEFNNRYSPPAERNAERRGGGRAARAKNIGTALSQPADSASSSRQSAPPTASSEPSFVRQQPSRAAADSFPALGRTGSPGSSRPVTPVQAYRPVNQYPSLQESSNTASGASTATAQARGGGSSQSTGKKGKKRNLNPPPGFGSQLNSLAPSTSDPDIPAGRANGVHATPQPVETENSFASGTPNLDDSSASNLSVLLGGSKKHLSEFRSLAAAFQSDEMTASEFIQSFAHLVLETSASYASSSGDNAAIYQLDRAVVDQIGRFWKSLVGSLPPAPSRERKEQDMLSAWNSFKIKVGFKKPLTCVLCSKSVSLRTRRHRGNHHTRSMPTNVHHHLPASSHSRSLLRREYL